MNDTTRPAQPLADGSYSWAAVQPFGPAVTQTAQVIGGRVVSFVTGTGEGALTASARQLHEAQAAYRAGVVQAVQGTTRYGTGSMSFTPATQPIGAATACTLHRDLGRLGYTQSASHYQLAAEVLGRPVDHLRTLSRPEAAEVWTYACAQLGLPNDGCRAA